MDVRATSDVLVGLFPSELVGWDSYRACHWGKYALPGCQSRDDLEDLLNDLIPNPSAELVGATISTFTLLQTCTKVLPNMLLSTIGCSAGGFLHGRGLWGDVQDPDDEFYWFE
jgi:hypothetical protein